MTAPVSAPFSLCGGHPVLDLVNTLDNRFRADGPTELLGDYATVLAFMEHSGLLNRETIATLVSNDTTEVVDSVCQLRESAAAVLYAIADGTIPPGEDVRNLERCARQAAEQQELIWNPEDSHSRFVWKWRSAQPSPELPLWLLALQTAALLTSDSLSRLRTCQCDTCRWLFLDTSKNHSRRWCDMKVCGNRMKARRFQARRM